MATSSSNTSVSPVSASRDFPSEDELLMREDNQNDIQRRSNTSSKLPVIDSRGQTKGWLKADQGSKAAIEEQASPEALHLIGAVSHEMRNPLNGILGMAHLLDATTLDGTQRNYLDGITSSGEVLLRLVNDLLDLTALTNGAMKPVLGPTDVAQLVNRCVEMAAPRAHSKRLALGSFIDPILVGHETVGSDTRSNSPEAVRVQLDQQRVEQVITNLLTNAIKFTKAGGVKLTVTLDQDPEPNLLFEVHDTGEGIAPKDQATVFQPFGRTDSARHAAIEGTGLGLPLSRGLAKAMGGDLSLVYSQLGAGSQMRLTLPFQPIGPVARQAKPLIGHRVLVALSPELAQSPESEVLLETLAALGAEAQCTHQAEALDHEAHSFDHMLIDASFDHAVLWARLNLAKSSMRPVLLLRPTERDSLESYRAAGFGGYLVRPVRQKSLVCLLTESFSKPSGERFIADPIDVEPGEEPDKILRVLIAEDDPVNGLLARTALERAGHSVSMVENGARAIALATQTSISDEEQTFDVVLLDLSMPVIDGFQAATQMRKLGYQGRLLAYSGNTDPALLQQLQDAGFDGFAQKPMPPDDLVSFVSSDNRAAISNA